MRSKTDKAIREALGDFLGILEYKVRYGVINMDDMRAILEAIEASGGIRATVKDLAGYYNEEFAQEDIAKMYYKSSDGKEHHAPYWTVDQVKGVYETISRQIPDYNFWDFYVTLQMTKADNCPLIMRWFPNATTEERDKMLVEMAVNWLDDPDSPNNGHKIWSYLNK